MSEEIFRKKSLDKMKSPESLDDYIRVSNPGVWLLLVSVIVLLAGVCVWGVFGHIDSTVETSVQKALALGMLPFAAADMIAALEDMTGIDLQISKLLITGRFPLSARSAHRNDAASEKNEQKGLWCFEPSFCVSARFV